MARLSGRELSLIREAPRLEEVPLGSPMGVKEEVEWAEGE